MSSNTEYDYNLNNIADDYASSAVDAAIYDARQDDADPNFRDLDDIIYAANDYAWQIVDGCAEVIYHHHAGRLVAENLSDAEDAAAWLDLGDAIAEKAKAGDLCSVMSLYAFALLIVTVQSLIPDVAESRTTRH